MRPGRFGDRDHGPVRGSRARGFTAPVASGRGLPFQRAQVSKWAAVDGGGGHRVQWTGLVKLPSASTAVRIYVHTYVRTGYAAGGDGARDVREKNSLIQATTPAAAWRRQLKWNESTVCVCVCMCTRGIHNTWPSDSNCRYESRVCVCVNTFAKQMGYSRRGEGDEKKYIHADRRRGRERERENELVCVCARVRDGATDSRERVPV